MQMSEAIIYVEAAEELPGNMPYLLLRTQEVFLPNDVRKMLKGLERRIREYLAGRAPQSERMLIVFEIDLEEIRSVADRKRLITNFAAIEAGIKRDEIGRTMIRVIGQQGWDVDKLVYEPFAESVILQSYTPK
jgi:hypothetical protein